MILNFSFFSSIDVANESDCNDVAGDDDAIDAVVVVVIEECDWSVHGSPFASIVDRFSLEFWLIFDLMISFAYLSYWRDAAKNYYFLIAVHNYTNRQNLLQPIAYA